MPVFPSFMRRMQQASPAAPTLFQGGMTPRPYEIAPDPPPTRSSADGVREAVSKQIRYEDVAPKMEEVPQTPAFKPKDKYGLMDRLKMAFGGAGLGSQRGGGMGAIGGIIAGLVNPEGVDRAGYEAYRRPQYEAAAQSIQGRNKQKREAFAEEIKNREAISKINETNAPKYKQATGSQYTMLYDERTGQFVPAMDNGEPVEAASVVVGRGHDTTQRTVAKDNRKAAYDRLLQTLEGREKTTQMNIDARKVLRELMDRESMKRLRITEGGKWGRQKRQLQAEGYDLGTGTGTGAGTASARPGGGTETGTGTTDTKTLLDRLRPFLGLDDEEEQEDWWY